MLPVHVLPGRVRACGCCQWGRLFRFHGITEGGDALYIEAPTPIEGDGPRAHYEAQVRAMLPPLDAAC